MYEMYDVVSTLYGNFVVLLTPEDNPIGYWMCPYCESLSIALTDRNLVTVFKKAHLVHKDDHILNEDDKREVLALVAILKSEFQFERSSHE